MKSTSVLQKYISTLTNISFFDMISSCKGPRCRSGRRQGSWKQAAVVFWYSIFPSMEGPRFQWRYEVWEVCGIIHDIFGCSSSLLQSYSAMPRQLLKHSDPQLFWPLPPPPPLFHHCALLLPRRESLSLQPPLVTHSPLNPFRIWVVQEEMWGRWRREKMWSLIWRNMTIPTPTQT